MDRDNTLRRALYDSLSEAALTFYERWKETEAMQAELLHFSLDDGQWEQDWAIILSIANQPGSSLEQIHIFALAHILRRPIIVYGIKYVKNYHGDNIGLARFQGVYLPLLWEPTFCWRIPLALGYTRGHFTALVPMEVDLYAHLGARANIDSNEDAPTVYLPLMDYEGKVLPIHFLQASEIGHEVSLLHEWLDCCTTESGLLVAKQQLGRQPHLVRQMVEEWLHRYRSLAEMVHSAGNAVGPRLVVPPALSSDSESDDE
jgi:ubiquitin thioesterase ZRANB1